MTPAPQPQHPYALQEYIITEHELFLYESNGFWDRSERRDISALIRSRPTPSPNPCEDQGCTDTENCDEICEHQRIYTEAQVKEKITTERNAVLDTLDKKIDVCISCCPSDARQKPITILKRVKQTIQSLRPTPITPKESQP